MVELQIKLTTWELEVFDAEAALAAALAQEMYAAFAADVDFANFQEQEDGTLIVRDLCGDYGMPLPLDSAGPINAILQKLGIPDVDFDGDLARDERGVFGWGRVDEFDEATLRDAIEVREEREDELNDALIDLQSQLTRAMSDRVAGSFEAIDFRRANAGNLFPVAAMSADGRHHISLDDPKWQEILLLASRIREPAKSNLQLNEISGDYRLTVHTN